MSGSERGRELRRRRHRRKKADQIKSKLSKASVSEKAHLAGKLRALTPGAEKMISDLGMEER